MLQHGHGGAWARHVTLPVQRHTPLRDRHLTLNWRRRHDERRSGWHEIPAATVGVFEMGAEPVSTALNPDAVELV